MYGGTYVYVDGECVGAGEDVHPSPPDLSSATDWTWKVEVFPCDFAERTSDRDDNGQSDLEDCVMNTFQDPEALRASSDEWSFFTE